MTGSRKGTVHDVILLTLVEHYRAAKEFRCILVKDRLFIKAIILPFLYILHVIPIPPLSTAAFCLLLLLSSPFLLLTDESYYLSTHAHAGAQRLYVSLCFRPVSLLKVSWLI